MAKAPKISVAIVGISGYAGIELARLLLRHPFVHLAAGYTSQGSFRLSDILPEVAALDVPVYPLEALPNGSLALKEIKEINVPKSNAPSSQKDGAEYSLLNFAKPGNLIFLATPADVSSSWVPKLIQQGCHVIDLSGAFRLSQADAQKWYGLKTDFTAALAQAEYGLVPWVGALRTDLSTQGRLVANPGCYPTCVLMAILPLLRAGLIDPSTLVIDAKSGTTGAGRKATQNLLFSEVEGECLPYKVGQHQHYPEICKYAGEYSAAKIDPFFTTQLLNFRRGMIASIYAKTTEGVTLEKVASCYDRAYENYPLAKCLALNSESSSGLSLKRVVGSARVEIRFHLSGNKLTVFSLLDNLMKGAASQAVENFNRIFDCPLNTGLVEWEGVL